MNVKNYSALLLTAVSCLLTSALSAQTIVCAETNLASFCMQLLEADAPIATANFLRYVDSGQYNGTLIHRSVRGAATYLSGGSYQASLEPVPVVASAPIINEFKLPNIRGTVAFETLPGQPNSATSGWRINVANNSNTFSSSASSGAVFAQILGGGMDVVDRMYKLPVYALNSTFLGAAPMLKLDNKVTVDDILQVIRLYRYAGTLDDFNTYGVNFPVVDPTEVLTDVVCMQTSLGELCIKLFPEEAPKTVDNFLQYVRNGDYDNTFIHREVSGFVVQGGGYHFINNAAVAVTSRGPVVNEYSRLNTSGTIAMAKLGGDPNSATNEWFFNIGNNSQTLNTNNNGGFTVFGEVIPSSLETLQAMALITPYSLANLLGGNFTEVPLVNPTSTITAANLITIESVAETQRNVSDPTAPVKGPLSNVVAMSAFGTSLFPSGMVFPVRIGSKLYQMVIHQNPPVNDGDPFTYKVDTFRIIELKDNGRIAATFDNQLLMIPTVRAGDTIYTNVVLRLTNLATLEFLLQSYEQM